MKNWIKFTIIFLIVWYAFFGLGYIMQTRETSYYVERLPLWITFILWSVFGVAILASWLGIMYSVKSKRKKDQ